MQFTIDAIFRGCVLSAGFFPADHEKTILPFFGGEIKPFGGFINIFGFFLLHFWQKILETPDFPTPWPGILQGGGG
jgi:hypothetical protein